jgi:hypothetical protein
MKYLLNIILIAGIISFSKSYAQSDLCSGAVSIAVNSSCITTAYNIPQSYATEASSTVPSCYAGGIVGNCRDGWFTFTTGASTTQVTITGTTSRNLVLVVYSGSCGSMTEVGCTDAGGAGVTENLTITVTPSTTYLLRVIRKNVSLNSMSGNICVYEPATAPSNDQCAGATAVTCGNTYSGTTIFATSTGDPTSTCTTTAGTPGLWYQFAGTGSTVTASLCGSSYDTKIQVFSGTCGSMTCVVGNDDYCGLQSQVTWSAASGTTYYIFVCGYFGATGSYTLAMTCVTPSAPNCAAYTSPANASTLSCNTTNLTWNAPTTGGTPTQYLLNFGTNNPPSNINNATNIGNVLTYTPSSLTPNTTYYWQIVPQNGAGSATGCSIYSFTTGPSTLTNDNCGGAIALTSGVTINDDNSCATDEAPMVAATCWSTGTVNSLWYSVTVPAAGTLGVLTTGGTLTNTQIAVYSGPCSSTMTQVGCNDNAPGPGCTGGTTVNSQVNLTGLSAGTYYIRVDGRSAGTGTYNIMASTTGSVGTAVPVPGQDCLTPTPVCANPMPVGNPGYSGTGNICDFSATGNCTSGELNSVWLQITINVTGSLNFTILPNDYAGCDNETDYDFLLWKISGGGTTTTCSGITSNSATALAACNYSYLGVTGVSPSGTAPSPYCATYDASFEPSVAVTAGDIYYLVVQNYSSSTSGFTITFPTGGANAGINTSSPSTVLWTGGASTTAWTTTNNWGGCTTPNCSPGVDGIVTGGPTSQPTVTGSQNVKNLTINSGATLTIGAGATLNVCGDFTNNGTLICGAGSVVNFNGTGAQNISGNLTGTNKFANFTITKSSGTANLLSNIEVGENLTTANATSILNTNGVDITLGGNFSNYAGTTTFYGITSTSTFTFNGTGSQTYDPTVNSGTNVTQNNVVTNNSRAGYGDITLNDDLLIGSTGTLTLTAGDILTGSFRTEVLNTTAAAVTTGNTTSFVNGNLRRYLTTSGLYEFPVGNTIKGYQRASTNFSSCSIGYLDAKFATWPVSAPTQGGTECGTTYNMPAEDNGYWTLTANAGTGTYNMTLYPTNATNTSGIGGWTVIKDPTIGSGTWSLNGSCDPSSTAAIVKRNGMSGFSVFGAGQAVNPLPIELLTFDGKSEGSGNKLWWITASEINNDYFTLEHSRDGSSFETFFTKAGAGNSSIKINYEAYDDSPFNGITYYRLKQTDFNGKFSYSQIISIENKLDQITVSNIHPNPTNDEVNFDFYSPVGGVIKIKIMDIAGRCVAVKTQNIEEGKTSLNTQMNSLAKGVYSLKVEFSEGNFKSITKVIKY